MSHYTYRVKAVNASGSSAYGNPVTVAISGSPAGCHIDEPTGSVTKNLGDTLLVKVSASDPDGVERVKIYLSGVEKMSDSSSPYELSLPLTNAGTFTLTAKVKDLLGNYTDSDNSRTITVNGGTTTTVTFYSVGVHDGYVDESSETSNVGGTNVATLTTGTALRVGDTGARKQRKSIVSFDTSTLPDTAVVTAATLKLKRGGGIGTPTSLGSLIVDIKNISAGFGTSLNLEKIDFEAAASASSVGTLNYPATTNAWATAALNTNGTARIAKTNHTQFRIRFATDDDNDSADDYLG
ncbi:MAG: Ig-like domain-containing protein [Pontiellaceae bacterium]|nr:Ig-like domain-containing protein [Pontiellaceae bacterium]